MKGIVLAGGLGSRLRPLTSITNKHLLPVYNRPMIYYPLSKLMDAGIEEICLVVGGAYAGQFIHLLGNGERFNLSHLHYVYQEGEGGIAEALGLTRKFVGDDDVVVILGDNILSGSIYPFRKAFEQQTTEKKARILLATVADPTRFGNPKFDGEKIVRIVEKPKKSLSSFAVTGIYCYDSSVFEMIDTLSPSDRGELEITDINNMYLEAGQLEYSYAPGWWTDAGTFESLRQASEYVYLDLQKHSKML